MRINGRTLRPTTLSERRLLLSLGVPELKVTRRFNPFIVARRFARAARAHSPDHDFVRQVAGHVPPLPPPPIGPSPEPDHTGTIDPHEQDRALAG